MEVVNSCVIISYLVIGVIVMMDMHCKEMDKVVLVNQNYEFQVLDPLSCVHSFQTSMSVSVILVMSVLCAPIPTAALFVLVTTTSEEMVSTALEYVKMDTN